MNLDTAFFFERLGRVRNEVGGADHLRQIVGNAAGAV